MLHFNFKKIIFEKNSINKKILNNYFIIGKIIKLIVDK